MTRKARTRHTELARKGARLLPVYQTRVLLNRPDQTAVTLFKTVISPRRSLSPGLSPAVWERLNSATSHASKTVKSRVVPIPPSMRPAKIIGILDERVRRHDRLYMMQKARQAFFRPYRSARLPMNVALIAPDINPVEKSAATVFSGSPSVCLYKE